MSLARCVFSDQRDTDRRGIMNLIDFIYNENRMEGLELYKIHTEFSIQKS